MLLGTVLSAALPSEIETEESEAVPSGSGSSDIAPVSGDPGAGPGRPGLPRTAPGELPEAGAPPNLSFTPPPRLVYDVGRFTIDVANDDFGSGVDQGFTSGIDVLIRISPNPRFSISGLSPFLAERRVREYWGLRLGQEIHTPALLQEVDLEVLRNDRRYAGWLYGALRAELALEHSPFLAGGYAFYRVELTFGSTGPRTETEALHRYWHAFIREVLNRQQLPEDPKGWSVYQVPNHWGLNLELSQEAELFRLENNDLGLRKSVAADLGFRAASLARVRLGNMWVDAAVGATFRAGLLPEVVFDELSIPVGLAGRPADVPLAVYGFVSGRLIGSLYNALLDGPPGAEGPHPDRNAILTRLEAGFVLRFSSVEFMFRHVTLTPDLERRPPGGVWIQNWGRITLTFAFY